MSRTGLRTLTVLTVVGFTSAGTVSPLGAFEAPQHGSAATYLGNLVEGPNYKVAPLVRSDGFMRIYVVDTPYGRFQVSGDDLMKKRIQELKAIEALDQMSKSDVFAKSLGNAAVAPLRFGADLVTNPADTVGRSFSGITNMFDRLGAGLENQRASRDSVMDSALGVDQARRELAVELNVDPYTDFAPLSAKLQDIASAAAMGGITIKAALAVIPGGVGLVISSTSTVSSVKDALRDKTSAQIIHEVKVTLQRLGVPDDLIAQLGENPFYTPADLLIMANALARLRANNSVAFIARAAEANARDVALFQRRRAELLANRSNELGGLTEFINVAGFPMNRARDGRIIAAFPFDEIAWTAITARLFTAASEELRGSNAPAPLLASHGAATAMAAGEIRKLGWTIVVLK